MLEFSIVGPLPAKTVKNGKNRGLDDCKKGQTKFWDACQKKCKIDLRNLNGCYVFALRHKAIVPYYVGMTGKGFRNEVFNSYQLTKYNKAMGLHGKPVFFFIYKKFKKKESARNIEMISEVEKILIQQAAKFYPDLLNLKDRKDAPKWRIKGVLGPQTQGQPLKSAQEFKKMMELK